jgi:uncharacterized protein (TIGR02186 family)
MRTTGSIFVAALCAASFLAPLDAFGTEGPSSGAVGIEASKPVIEVGLGYDGDRIDFFGSVGGTGADAIVVKLTSPAETVKLNIKGRVGPFWMNTRQYQVDNVPSMYQIQASAPLAEITTPELADELRIGFETIKRQMKYEIVKGEKEANDEETLFQGLMKIKTGSALYSIDETGRIEIKEGKLFSHSMDFPSAAKPGVYNVDYFLLKEKTLVGKASKTIEIRKVGLVAFVAEAAEKQPLVYGICAVLIALGAGLAVGFVFKGGGH